MTKDELKNRVLNGGLWVSLRKENGKTEPVKSVVGFMTVSLKQRRNNNE